jgi:hypothetical protein
MYLAIQLSTRKFNNMRFRIIIFLSDFMQVLNIKRKHSTKNEHFSKHN